MRETAMLIQSLNGQPQLFAIPPAGIAENYTSLVKVRLGYDLQLRVGIGQSYPLEVS